MRCRPWRSFFGKVGTGVCLPPSSGRTASERDTRRGKNRDANEVFEPPPQLRFLPFDCRRMEHCDKHVGKGRREFACFVSGKVIRQSVVNASLIILAKQDFRVVVAERYPHEAEKMRPYPADIEDVIGNHSHSRHQFVVGNFAGTCAFYQQSALENFRGELCLRAKILEDGGWRHTNGRGDASYSCQLIPFRDKHHLRLTQNVGTRLLRGFAASHR